MLFCRNCSHLYLCVWRKLVLRSGTRMDYDTKTIGKQQLARSFPEAPQ